MVTLNLTKKGDVYIRLKDGLLHGIAGNERVVEDRFSVHPTLKSECYTMCKRTYLLADNNEMTSVSLTDAVKLQSEFSLISAHRASELSADLFDIDGEEFSALSLGDFDPKRSSLSFAVFLGSPDCVFDRDGPDWIGVQSFNMGQFQFVVCSLRNEIPSLPYSWTIARLTMDPEVSDANEAEVRKGFLKANGPAECLGWFYRANERLKLDLIDRWLENCSPSDINTSHFWRTLRAAILENEPGILDFVTHDSPPLRPSSKSL